MSFWVEIVCDKCADRGPGMHVESGKAFVASLNADARSDGWWIRMQALAHTVHLCTHCARATGRKERTEL
jgi:hypothetical protein